MRAASYSKFHFGKYQQDESVLNQVCTPMATAHKTGQWGEAFVDIWIGDVQKQEHWKQLMNSNIVLPLWRPWSETTLSLAPAPPLVLSARSYHVLVTRYGAPRRLPVRHIHHHHTNLKNNCYSLSTDGTGGERSPKIQNTAVITSITDTFSHCTVFPAFFGRNHQNLGETTRWNDSVISPDSGGNTTLPSGIQNISWYYFSFFCCSSDHR